MLIIGASGGVGTAFLQLGQLANLTMYGIASKSKHHILTEYGATPIDYHTQDFVEIIRQAEPDGLDNEEIPLVVPGGRRPWANRILLKRFGRDVLAFLQEDMAKGIE